MNFDNDYLKNSANMMGQMSDEDIRRASNMMPGMGAGGMSPEMLRNASNMMSGMSDEQLNQMKNMAQNFNGMPGMPNMNNPFATPYQQPTASTSTTVKEDTPYANKDDQKKFDNVTELKNKANTLFKNKELDKASEKYYEAINKVRTTTSLKGTPQADKLEMNCRLNLALCKIKQEEYDVAIDQCERVLLEDNSNLKALYRISLGLKSQNNGLEAWSYIKRAYKIDPNDQNIKKLHSELKPIKDEFDAKFKKEQQEKQKPQEQEPKMKTPEEKKAEEEGSKESDPKIKRAKVLKSSMKFTKDDEEERPKEYVQSKTHHEEVKIEEEKVPEAQPPQQQEEGPFNRFNRDGFNMPPGMAQNMSDEQINTSINMMKQNPEMMKNMMKSQGMNMGDAQMDAMMNMMSPEMFKMAQQMQQNGANPPNMGSNNTENAGFPNMGTGMPNMSGPQGEQMQKMASEMMNNPEMLKNMMSMFTDDPNGPMMQMLKQQFPNANPAMLARCMKVLSYFVLMYAYIRKAWSYTIVKLIFFAICVYFVAWLIK
ncbi:unnamed protein product [Moneuplotes crassus]|uniref:Uncharacterized protein n=1 Tax=Euplotes crassus TaxID=5936 RepID=A0AAD1UDV0_EUPCR|nr:unnamed protein product [Moneuplotes crassus]